MDSARRRFGRRQRYLSLEVAQPADWWFHADKVPGSHVILRAKADEEPSSETLRQAAAVAGYHSKARNGTIPFTARARGTYETARSQNRHCQCETWQNFKSTARHQFRNAEALGELISTVLFGLYRETDPYRHSGACRNQAF